MKILAIRGRNLASLAGEFSVDFDQEPLKSAGLFAISGPTGAGKSTLLDALCLALYDDTPRLLKAVGKGVGLPDVGDKTVTPHDTRTLLRRGTAEGYAEVDFIGNDILCYRARWSVRRARGKADGGLLKVDMSLKRLPELQGIGGTNSEVKLEIISRIGLSFEQFTRAVLLAQNEFSAFLKADDNERGELLETLTGSAIYSQLSKSAFARAKEEALALQRLNERLADQRPLSDDIRSQLEQDSVAASTALAALDLRKQALESHLRWHQDDDKFQRQEQLAQEQLQQKQAEQHAASARRAVLQQVESVQPARALVAESVRLARDIALTQTHIADCQGKLDNATLTCQQADSALEAAQAALQQAELAQAQAAPLLDQAKGLDTRIEAMLPTHQQALQAQTEAAHTVQQARQHQHAKQTALDAARKNQQVTEDWLKQHAPLEILAEQWPRWDVLLQQASGLCHDIAQQQEGLKQFASDATSQHNSVAACTTALADSTNALQTAEQTRQQALQRYSGIDSTALQGRKQDLETRREQLACADQLWRTLSEKQTRRQNLQPQVLQLQQANALLDSALTQTTASLPVLAAALVQAERSLKSAETACADSVEDLRAALETDAPCPVCGGTDHPYAESNPQLRAMLASLQDQVRLCRQQSQQAQQQHAVDSAQAAANRRQIDAIRHEQAGLDSAIGVLIQDCQTHPLALQLQAVAPEQLTGWLAQERTATASQLQQVSTEEAAWRSAASARDQAQGEYERIVLAHSSHKEALTAAQAALTHTLTRQQAATDQITQSQQRLRTSLDDLDAAFHTKTRTQENDTEDTATGWKQSWQADPSGFHALCAANAQQWLNQRKAREHGLQAIATLALELTSLSEAATRAEAEQQRAIAAYATCDTALQAMQLQRRALFLGQPVQQVAATLASAIQHAKTSLAQHTVHSNDSKQAHTRCTEALAQAGARQASLTQESQHCAAQLQDWIARYQTAHGPLDEARLHALLQHIPEWINSERAALHALDADAQQAATVLQERRTQRHAHQQQRPQAEPVDAMQAEARDNDATSFNSTSTITNTNTPTEILQQALHNLNAERNQAHASATACQLALAQDDAKRQQSTAMLATIATQEARHRLWAQLNELIGAADGKKFRNYAQQYTLDVLLGYANRHLHDLSRRYRLQRVKDTLALMVVDQDMGDELRSVHSLSGGESFLVSLALALGLASLSSNRVKVESLFIDEGFGSLDAETLRVAMDALDGLQAMGRKVGVISHVQEMTERIATKVMVQRTTGGRSLVAVGN